MSNPDDPTNDEQWPFGGLAPEARGKAAIRRVIEVARHMAKFMFAFRAGDLQHGRVAARDYLNAAIALNHTLLLPQILAAHLLHRLGVPPDLPDNYDGLSDAEKLALDAADTKRALDELLVSLTDLVIPSLGIAATPFEAVLADAVRVQDGHNPITVRPDTPVDRRQRDRIELAERNRAVLMAYYLAGKRAVRVEDLLPSIRYAPGYSAFEKWAARVSQEARDRMHLIGQLEARGEGLPIDQLKLLTPDERVVLARHERPAFAGRPDEDVLSDWFAYVQRQGDFGLVRQPVAKHDRN